MNPRISGLILLTMWTVVHGSSVPSHYKRKVHPISYADFQHKFPVPPATNWVLQEMNQKLAYCMQYMDRYISGALFENGALGEKFETNTIKTLIESGCRGWKFPNVRVLSSASLKKIKVLVAKGILLGYQDNARNGMEELTHANVNILHAVADLDGQFARLNDMLSWFESERERIHTALLWVDQLIEYYPHQPDPAVLTALSSESQMFNDQVNELMTVAQSVEAHSANSIALSNAKLIASNNSAPDVPDQVVYAALVHECWHRLSSIIEAQTPHFMAILAQQESINWNKLAYFASYQRNLQSIAMHKKLIVNAEIALIHL